MSGIETVMRSDDTAAYFHQSQQGASLIVTLLVLIVVLLLGISATQIALQGEKASRSDRDHQVAFQAAEAGLMDAELDIEGMENAPQAAIARSSIFASDKTEGFTAGCGVGLSNLYLGLCADTDGGSPAWRSVDFMDESSQARSVPYGRFTGQSFQTGQGTLPAKPPRYIIELLTYNKAGESADADKSYFYRITAIGFGMRDTTQVALQTFYRKGEKR